MKVGDAIETQRGAWSFAGEVADTFVSHAERSIPMYREGHALVCRISDYFVLPNSLCYELGSSTGELTRRLAEHNAHKANVQWVGMDREESMAARAREHCAGLANVNFVCEDLGTAKLEKANLIVSYYTLQFVPPRYRQDVFNRIYESLEWGGAFLMFEKVRAPDARFQDITTGLYNDFKTDSKFAAEEIINKSVSLRGVMEPFSTQGNFDLMARAGFKDMMTIFKYVCFEGFLAIK